MYGLRIQRERAEEARHILQNMELIDKRFKFEVHKGEVTIPLKRLPREEEIATIPNAEIVSFSPAPHPKPKTPFQEVYETLDLPPEKKAYLPKKWELIGDVLILPLPQQLFNFKKRIAEVYAEVLGAQTVVRLIEIEGKERKQRVEVLLGKRTETIHKENGILYKMDTAHIMFSSGNIDERMRMAKVNADGEIVVDMFAGIGYFTLPIAVYATPESVISYEVCPTAYKYLVENITLNEVTSIVDPILGDCLEAEEHVADRVIMGYLHNTEKYLPKALRVLKNKGIIHYHENCPNVLLPRRPVEHVIRAAKEQGKSAQILSFRRIKSYAPGVTHVVLDVKITPQ